MNPTLVPGAEQLANLHERIEWCRQEMERASQERDRVIMELKKSGVSSKELCFMAQITYPRLYQIIGRAKKNESKSASERHHT